ncbi:dioxygenase family protein [Flavobacterium silvaticum]|uniref:T9SS type A sorting domain-containing protein n=1 Tax=Flavobacterium silvaticum TaxID=1852020 RepID=A0A972FS98_9FLAO|nr:T9SS type A sorting domain-containing protein [Flavobacterium silvaticum]NMH28429.1 T9SS type A sorting domain-containing protein [Flavobacterium silvaticum]
MERKVFLRNSIGFLGLAMLAPEMLTAGKSELEEALVCSQTNSETAGPFPTINPSSYVTSDIVGDRTGVGFTVNITIKNVNGGCNGYEGALVDIWHCDKDGNYSQYGGTGMQPTNYTAYHFLRGRQVTDANGLVTFTSIFPGWYTGRATHIHVHIYNASGISLLVTQIAFPEGTSSAVNTVNAATSYGYTKGMTGYTYNSSDNVFSDGVSNELSTVSGSLADGYVLDHEIYVNGPTLGISDFEAAEDFAGQNYPNPVKDTTTIPVVMTTSGNVSFELFDAGGRRIGQPKHYQLSAGNNTILLDKNEYKLESGYYLYKITIDNGTRLVSFTRKLLVA